MKRLSNSQIDILALAAEAAEGPLLPAPESIENDIAGLLDEDLLTATGGRVEITDKGREALELHSERVLAD